MHIDVLGDSDWLGSSLTGRRTWTQSDRVARGFVLNGTDAVTLTQV